MPFLFDQHHQAQQKQRNSDYLYNKRSVCKGLVHSSPFHVLLVHIFRQISLMLLRIYDLFCMCEWVLELYVRGIWLL